MKPIPIKLQPSHSTAESPTLVGGWMATDNPEHWLMETVHLRKSGLKQTPGIHPITLEGNTLGAVILVGLNENPTFSRRVSPLVSLLPNVLSLKSAQLNLTLLDHEIHFSAFPSELYLFLPSTGLITLERNATLKPRDFIILEQSTLSWNHAVPAPISSSLLKVIRVELPEEEEISIDAEGIGDLKDQKIDSSKSTLNKIGKGLGLGLGGLAAGPILGLGKIINMLPDGPGSTSPSAFDKLEDWAAKNWKKIQNARQQELDKLMDLMDKNPEEGLRYALPLGGHEARRGKAAPGWTLGQRDLRLGNSQGGAASDGWNLDYETQLRLEKQYRKAANDAEAKEDYERAAYIYGELLNDWAAAASALIKAGRHRDAVGIYLHKLNNKQQAAAALEKAGLTLQAAELYLELKNYEQSGDLFFKIGQLEQARDLWKQAVDHSHDPLDQARILNEKLSDRQAAIHTLDQAWRKNKQVTTCLKAQFKLLLLDKDQAPIQQLLDDLREAPKSTLDDLQKAKLCVELKRNVLSEPFHQPLEETVLRLASEQLRNNPSLKNGHNILNELKQIHPEDQLLNRDTTRFIVQNKTLKLGTSKQRKGHLSPSFELGVPQSGQWQSLASLGENVSIAGIGGGSLIAAQLQKRSCLGSELKTEEFNSQSRQVHHLGLLGTTHKARVFHFRGINRIHFRSINSKRTPTHDTLGTLPAVLAVGLVNDDSFMTLQYHSTGSLVAQHYGPSGNKQETIVLDLAPPEMTEPWWFCASRDNHSCFSANNFAAWRYPDGKIAACQLNEPIHKLVMAPHLHQVQALISSQHETALITPKKSGQPPEFINLYMSDGKNPCHATFTKNGDAIVLSGNRGEIYDAGKYNTPSATFSFPEKLGHAIDVAPRKAKSFVILTSKGRLVLFD